MYLKKYSETEKEDRPECVCYHILPENLIGNLGAGVVDIQPGGESLSDPHTEWRQVFFFLEGTGKLVLTDSEGKTTELRVEAETVAEIPYDTGHVVTADPGVRVRYLYVNDFSKPVKP